LPALPFFPHPGTALIPQGWNEGTRVVSIADWSSINLP